MSPSEPTQRCIILLADGARPDVLAELCDQGELPHLARHLVEGGSAREATTVFPSTTGPAHLPFLTGLFPGSCDIPGIRWFDPVAFEARRASIDRCRSYVGPGAYLLDRDLRAEVKSLYDHVEDHANVFGNCTRGLRADRHLTRYAKLRLNLTSFFSTEYGLTDRECARILADEAAERRFVFAVLPGVDSESHKGGVRSGGTFDAYRRVDDTVGLLAQRLGETRLREEVVLLLVSDHGLSDTARHFDLERWLEGRRGPVLAYPRLRGLLGNPRTACMVSGNAMAHVHLRGDDDWGDEAAARALGAGLCEEEAIDVVAWREGATIVVRSRAGEANICLLHDALTYEAVRGDPLGYGPLPARMTLAQAHELTVASHYPDGLVQLAQLFRTRRCGDLVVTAAPGWDLRARFERPPHRGSHGALHREHMRTPLWSNRRLPRGALRTVDVFAAVLQRLGLPVPAGLDGVPFTIS